MNKPLHSVDPQDWAVYRDYMIGTVGCPVYYSDLLWMIVEGLRLKPKYLLYGWSGRLGSWECYHCPDDLSNPLLKDSIPHDWDYAPDTWLFNRHAATPCEIKGLVESYPLVAWRFFLKVADNVMGWKCHESPTINMIVTRDPGAEETTNQHNERMRTYNPRRHDIITDPIQMISVIPDNQMTPRVVPIHLEVSLGQPVFGTPQPRTLADLEAMAMSREIEENILRDADDTPITIDMTTHRDPPPLIDRESFFKP